MQINKIRQVFEVEVANVKVGVANALPPFFGGGEAGLICRDFGKKF